MRIKWLASTCLAGMVGVAVIGVAIYASLNVEDGSGIMDSMRQAGLAALEPIRGAAVAGQGQGPIGEKTDKIKTSVLGVATRHIIHDTLVQKRGEREFITIKPYARVVARLATARPGDVSAIPPFNPFKLHLNDSPLDGGSGPVAEAGVKDIVAKLIDLPGNNVPREDGMSLSTDQIARLVAEANENFQMMARVPFAMREEGAGGPILRVAYGPENVSAAGQPEPLLLPRNTTVAIKNPNAGDAETGPEQEGSEVTSVEVKRGDTLMSICVEAGVEPSSAKALSDAIAEDFRATKLQPGYDIRLTLIEQPSDAGAVEAMKVSIFDGDEHKATVRRSPLGDYVVSNDPVDVVLTTESETTETGGNATLYTSFYHAAMNQHVPPGIVEKLLRVHSYDVDFKQRVRAGDSFELFFDTKDGPNGENSVPNEVLYTEFTADGETRGFYRFRTPDGIVDYYDRNGDSAKRFLDRKPVKGARFTSGFGMRKHPLLRIRRMHSGVDYAAPSGTPILAAGDGVVEAAGRNGGYGNYVRIRHANGFKTTYGHMSRYAPGLEKGTRVKQGQVIGFIGTTGVSTGPHLHFEVMVNNRFVDPMTIKVPRGAQLQGRNLAEFHEERRRIDALMARTPVTTRVAAVNN